MNWFQRQCSSILGLDNYIEQSGSDYFLFDASADFDAFTTDAQKIRLVFNNPAVLKVFKLQCDMFSLGKIYVYKKEKEVTEDPILNLFKNPNPFQQTEQFLWDFMFWKMIGNAYVYVDSDNPLSDSNKMYLLDPSKMEFPEVLRINKDKLILSTYSESLIKDALIKYTYDDSTSVKLKWGKITHISDLTNGSGNWFKGKSTIDALYEIISNSKAATRSKNINVRYSGKYMVAGQQDPENVSKIPLSSPEKADIESKMNGRKTVHAVKSMIDIKRFIENSSIIGDLDESYFNDYFMIGSEFGIPREVLEAYLKGGSTYENQEKARGAHVSYTLSPAACQLMGALSNRFNYKNKTLVMDWEYLPFMQVFAKDRAETTYKNTQSLLNLAKLGINIEEINSTLDTNYTFIDYEAAKRSGFGSGNTGSEGENQQSEN